MKKTLVIGASENPQRYSNKAIRLLRRFGHSVVAIGLREGNVSDVKIVTGFPSISNVDTVTLYIGPQRQSRYYDYIFSLKPRRIIFNPGTENDEFMVMAEKKGVEVVENCTLVMLSGGKYHY